MNRILCIDDMPARYSLFYAQATRKGVLPIITEDPDMIDIAIQPLASFPLLGVCLDHDMPNRDAVEICRRFLIVRNLPVAIVSTNPYGSDRLADILSEYAVPHMKIPASIGGQSWVDQLFQFFQVFDA